VAVAVGAEAVNVDVIVADGVTVGLAVMVSVALAVAEGVRDGGGCMVGVAGTSVGISVGKEFCAESPVCWHAASDNHIITETKRTTLFMRGVTTTEVQYACEKNMVLILAYSTPACGCLRRHW
jgi:hypothetical protein